jgi:hypothetical protein
MLWGGGAAAALQQQQLMAQQAAFIEQQQLVMQQQQQWGMPAFCDTFLPSWMYGSTAGLQGAYFACSTSTKVQIPTPSAERGRIPESAHARRESVRTVGPAAAYLGSPLPRTRCVCVISV